MRRKGEQTTERIMQAIVSYIAEHQYAPTVREIGSMTGINSTSSVHHYIGALLAEGKLETDAGLGSSRALRVPGYKFIKECSKDENKGR